MEKLEKVLNSMKEATVDVEIIRLVRDELIDLNRLLLKKGYSVSPDLMNNITKYIIKNYTA
jgi:hypothetical protein